MADVWHRETLSDSTLPYSRRCIGRCRGCRQPIWIFERTYAIFHDGPRFFRELVRYCGCTTTHEENRMQSPLFHGRRFQDRRFRSRRT